MHVITSISLLCFLISIHHQVSAQGQLECEAPQNGVTVCRNVMSMHELATKALADWSKLMIVNEPESTLLIAGFYINKINI